MKGRTTVPRFARLAVAAAALMAAAFAAQAGSASQLIDRNATDVRLSILAGGTARLTYRAGGQTKNVLAWGATNALAPSTEREQVKLKLDYSGRGRERDPGTCRPYDGPELAWLAAACKAPDGSYWAVQTWQRGLPNYGVDPTPPQAAWELRLSHWSGPLAQLEVYRDWVYSGRFHHVFGRFTYRGQPVHGFRATRTGAPLDSYGRNFYLDTFNSSYGAGWKRENSFLAHRPTGTFCYGFFPHRGSLLGHGERYRISVIGPGVTPDLRWDGGGLPNFEAGDTTHLALDREMNQLRRQLTTNDKLCRD